MSEYPREATIFAACCAVVFCAIGIAGNAITIAALIRCPKLRTNATTAFVLSLCTSDLIFCCLNLPLTASRYIYEEWTLGDVLCKLFPVLFYGNVAVSVLNMVAITVNRYILISYHHLYSLLYSKLSISIQLICIWTLAFLLMLPPLLGVWGQLGLDEGTFSCTILPKDGKSPKKVIFLLGFALPCTVILISYTCIFYNVRRTRLKLKPNVRSSRREKDDSRLTKLMAIIFVCFVLSFLPLMLMNVFDSSVKFPVGHVLASILAWASSVINPFIYAASNRQYRSAYTKLFIIVKSSVVVSDSRQVSNCSKQERNGSVQFRPSGSEI